MISTTASLAELGAVRVLSWRTRYLPSGCLFGQSGSQGSGMICLSGTPSHQLGLIDPLSCSHSGISVLGRNG
jgi:hypothetical protein